MSVRNRLILTFAAVGVLLVVPALFAASGLRMLRDMAVEGRGRHAEAALSVGRVQAAIAELDLSIRGYVASRDVGRRDAMFRTLRDLEREVSRIESTGYADDAAPLRSSLGRVAEQVAAIDSLVQADGLPEATDRVLGDFEPATDRSRDHLGELASAIDQRAQGDFERARSIGAAALRTTLLALAGTFALALLLSAWTTRALTHPLRRLSGALARVTEGEFDVPPDLPYERRDEIGELSISFGIMSRRLAELDRLRAEFLGVASHELKTPINVIRGYAELIEEELAGEITPHQREIMQRIGVQTEVLARQVSRLMDISRLESGSYVVEPERTRFDELVMGVERSFEVVAQAKEVTLSVEVDEDAPEWVVVDVGLIRDEVLANLVSNAIKFTPSGGHVSVRAWSEAEGVVIEVSDTGPGIPEEHRAHIFEKYYQVERSRSLGSGLGLAIAKETVEAHGGRIELLDRGPPGATFRVHLPVEGEQIKPEVRLSS